MKIALTIADPGPADVLVAQVRFHLLAGVEHVLIGGAGDSKSDAAHAVRGVDDARVRVVPMPPGGSGSADGMHLVRVAAREWGADWVIAAEAGEFWWPRGTSLVDVLAPLPDRYGVVQGLVRAFVARQDDGRPFWQRMTVRSSLLQSVPAHTAPDSLLRPAYRAYPELGLTPKSALQPLRAWYPIEVLTFAPDADPIGDEEVEQGIADGSLVVDTRLRDALGSGGEAPVSLTLPVPGVVEDAAYAGECAAVREVDYDLLERHLRQLERRVVELEARSRPRLRRLASRAMRRFARS